MRAGTASTLTHTFTGPATGAGTLTGYVCCTRVQSLVTTGMMATQIATAFAAAINAIPSMPVTAATSGATVTCTADVVGPLDLDGRFNYLGSAAGEFFQSGVGATTIVALGTGAPDLTTALANLADQPFI